MGFLSAEELDAIRGTMIGDLSKPDRLVWPFDKRGSFTVKSGYHWARSSSTRPLGGRNVPTQVCKVIWKVNSLPKLCHFLWRILHDSLPTMANLYRMHSAPLPLCHICHDSVETIEHLLLQCRWVEAIWFGGALSYRVNRDVVLSWR